MHVLITTSTFPLWDNDGIPRFVYDLAKALSRRCRVTVLAPHHPGVWRQESFGNLTIERFQYSWPAGSQRLAYGYGMRDNIRQSWMAKAQVPVYIASLCLAVGKLLRKERFDVVNSHWIVPQGLAVSLALKGFPETAHVVTAHAGDVFLLKKMKVGKLIARYVASHTDMFLPVGSHVASNLNAMVGTQVPQAIQPMGVDHAVFSASPNKALPKLPFNGNFILFIGRLVEKKGLTYLLDALKLLFFRGFDVGLVVIGSGTLKARMKEKAFQLGIEDRVSFMGALGHESILPYLQSCKVVVIPSILDPSSETEGMPTVLAEALSCGCKVVASKVGGIPDVLIDGRNGWLARPADAQDLADKLMTALGHCGGNVGNNARQSVRDLDWGCIAERYGDVFRDAVQHRQGRKDRV
ncbi:MAG: glycosyltransferase [Desulfobacteraceae bacterium]|jgi:glycosyltransferase involved in cell wall biosynthesis